MDKKRDRLARQAVFVLGIGSLAGVLIWSKLRLVTDIPRSAYAVPENDHPSKSPGDPAVKPTGQADLAPREPHAADPAEESDRRSGVDVESGLADAPAGAPSPKPAAIDDPPNTTKND